MKASRLTLRIFLIGMIVSIGLSSASAQDESGSSFDVGADLVSNYIWRGSKFGTGPAVQPFIEFSAAGFTLGSWGSFGFTDNEAAEADLYLSYGFDFGLSLGLTDYYYPGTPYTDLTDSTGSHGLEVNLGYEIGGLSIGANYMINEAGGAGTAGGDMYFELGYGFDAFSVFVGGGNGWHTSTGDFGLCNIGISSSKEVKITDSYSLPISASAIWNPEKDQYFLVVGVSF